MSKMTEKEIIMALQFAWRNTAGDGWAGVLGCARELLASERPVATDEAINQFLTDGVGFGVLASPQNREYIGKFIRSTLSHFAPSPPELPPICGMTYGDLLEEMHKGRPSNWMMAKYPGEIVSECARVAHRLAQPAPKIDPDAEAKRVYSAFVIGTCMQQASWDDLPEGLKAGWRAVAAAKVESAP